MTVRHMKIFIQVYRTQNITRAGELLHMTQPAVTRAIHEIENYYGVCLFERINKRLFVTEIGKQLYAQSLHIVDAFDMLETGLRNWDTFGVLRIGASITLGNFLLPELVSQFQKEHTNIKIQATIANGTNLQKALLDNQLDIALIEGGVWEEELHTEAFDRDRLVLILPPGHKLMSKEKIELIDLLTYPFLLREKDSNGRAFLDNIFSLRGITLNPIWESASTQAIVKAVSLGLGISFLPEQLIYQDIVNGVISTREITDVDLTRQHYLVWHKNKYLTNTMISFISLCKSVHPANALPIE
ncbi:LysR family transcriptional regulator [Anaerocolumna sedimenticola]|uniref:LysR family transcriptional regulator n=1 Tax=Anaerocolumna sedimenticola TaxID=2696063 RepID=A0A6P1TL58_9FIRM|nr:LysR family transcriptional regulator [Anaerocolumna sedimenticola]QHQ60646.1 LysR family transcriptional regulator [Anaerocolumna sedimenticola]